MTIKRYFMDNGTGSYLPKRYRSFFYSREIDVVFFPCTHEDARHGAVQGVNMIFDEEDNPFLPISFLKERYPAEDFDQVEKNIRASMKEHGEVFPSWT